jgi:4,4'-diaponeurosporenoate glycosyltransferase
LYLTFAVLVLGMLFGFLLFFKHPFLDANISLASVNKTSVIIPARNEGNNLPKLLSDLKKQHKPVYEIICVNDSSDDNTAEVASSYGVKLINISDKPKGWVGKSWACQTGANVAQGDTLLFLDADVRLNPNAIEKLEQANEKYGCVISVQPYHQPEKLYEQFSFFFNLIMVVANGVGFPFFKKNIGLFGPVILISKDEYRVIDGHLAAKNSIVDDLTLGEKLKSKGIRFKLLLGGKDISFRMYSGGFRQLLQGWTKNFATGASKTSPLLIFMIIIWLSTCISSVIYFFNLIWAYSPENLAFAVLVYSIVTIELLCAARHIGSFKKWMIALFPLPLTVFLAIFLLSVFKKVFRLKVKWKGRNIEQGR